MKKAALLVALFLALVLGAFVIPSLGGSDRTLLHNDSGIAGGYNAGWQTGDMIGAVLSLQADQCPFKVDTLYFYLYSFDGAAPSAQVRAHIYPMEGSTPGATPLVSSAPVTITTFYRHWASIDLSAANVLLSDPGDFFLALEYTAGIQDTIPSIVSDDQDDILEGKNFYSRDGGATWIEHYDWWTHPTETGYTILRVTGEPRYSDVPDPFVPDLSGSWGVMRQYEMRCPYCLVTKSQDTTWAIIQDGQVFTVTVPGLTGETDGYDLSLEGIEVFGRETYMLTYYDVRLDPAQEDAISAQFFGSAHLPNPCAYPPTPQPMVDCSITFGSVALIKVTPTPTDPPDPPVTPPSAAPYLGLVANSGEGTVSALDLDTGTVIETISLGDPENSWSESPGGIAITPDQTMALVTFEQEDDHRVYALDLTAIDDGVPGNEILATLPLSRTCPSGSRSIAITPDGSRAYVAGQWCGAVIATIDIAAITDGIAGNEVSWLDTGSGYVVFENVAITPDGSRAYFSSDHFGNVRVLDIDPDSPTYHTFIATLAARGSAAITPDGRRAYTANSMDDRIQVIDIDPASPTYHTLLHEIDSDPDGSNPDEIAISPDGLFAHVTRSSSPTDVLVIDIDPTSPTYHDILDIVDVELSPSSIALAARGKRAIVANASSDSITQLDLVHHVEIESIAVGDNPHGIAVYLPPAPADHVLVVDADGAPRLDAFVYQNGALIGQADERGIVIPDTLGVGDTLVAMYRLNEQATSRAGHSLEDEADWAYRTYITNVVIDAGDIDPGGAPAAHTVTQLGQQRLTLAPHAPLVLFNLLVSIEWDATLTYTHEISRALHLASNSLYDLTDGQMAFGRVTIHDNSEHWADADIQISTKNIVRPHAYIGGIRADDTSHVIRLGRGWDGNSGNQGPWDQPDGYRTLVHEFGHYALYLYDEYFGYDFDANDNLIGEWPAYCTGPENRNPATDAVNASVMDYQYTASEFSARGVPGLWSDLCEQTVQWQLTARQRGQGESAWETLARVYADAAQPPRWALTTPMDRGGVLAGPDSLPGHVLALPQIEIDNPQAADPPRELLVLDPDGEPYWGAVVALYKKTKGVVGQGFTGKDGKLDIYGSNQGDTLHAATLDAGLAGGVPVDAGTSLTLTLSPVDVLATQSTTDIPHMKVLAQPAQDPGWIELSAWLYGVAAQPEPILAVTAPVSSTEHDLALNLDPATGALKGQIQVSAVQHGTGRIRSTWLVGGQEMSLQSTYRLHRVGNDREYDVHSDDGNLSLHLEPESLAEDMAYLVVMPPGALPGPLPEGWALVGDPYDVTASGPPALLKQPAALKLRYDGALVDPTAPPEGLSIYRWAPAPVARWQKVGGSLDEDQKALAAQVTELGTYALLAPAHQRRNTYLPLVLHIISRNRP